MVEDRVGDNMVMSVALQLRPIELGISAQTVSLCYQVHGEDGKLYNLISDDCISVNAHITKPISGDDFHVMNKIGIRAIGINGTCSDITIERKNCAVSVNRHPLSINTYFEKDGVKVFHNKLIAREPNVIHISVPNCGRTLVDVINITCTEYTMRNSLTPTEVLELTTTRGLYPIVAAEGLLGMQDLTFDAFITLILFLFSGQFWGRSAVGQSRSPPTPPEPHYNKGLIIFHQTLLKRFSGFISRSWSHKANCFYAGDNQGYPVIQGEYGDYEMEDLFSAGYQFSRFKHDLMCVASGSGSGSGLSGSGLGSGRVV